MSLDLHYVKFRGRKILALGSLRPGFMDCRVNCDSSGHGFEDSSRNPLDEGICFLRTNVAFSDILTFDPFFTPAVLFKVI